jgi:hypothetical protein
MKKKERKTKKEITLDDLALMVGKGFNEVGERLTSLERGQAVLERGQAELKKGQENIRTDLSRRVHIFDHKELEFRVERLEEKVGITTRKKSRQDL